MKNEPWLRPILKKLSTFALAGDRTRDLIDVFIIFRLHPLIQISWLFTKPLKGPRCEPTARGLHRDCPTHLCVSWNTPVAFFFLLMDTYLKEEDEIAHSEAHSFLPAALSSNPWCNLFPLAFKFWCIRLQGMQLKHKLWSCHLVRWNTAKNQSE